MTSTPAAVPPTNQSAPPSASTAPAGTATANGPTTAVNGAIPGTANKEQPPNKPICLPAGRYEFRDNGIYIGEWLDERAVGLGLITKDKSQGEYTGLWDAGSEKSGVFLWPNAPGAMYEGEWAANRRNGFGVFNREDWVIMGKFEDDFITMGVKGKDSSLGRFEGRFENGFPAFGVETYGDGGTYCGEYKNGIREGLGVRRSIPYGEVLDFYPEAKKAAYSSQLEDLRKRGKLPPPQTIHRRRHPSEEGSIDVPCDHEGPNFGSDLEDEDGLLADTEPYAPPKEPAALVSNPHEHATTIRLLATRRCGFVLTSKRSELFIRRLAKLKHPRANPFGCSTPGPMRKRTQSLSTLFTYPEELLTPQTGCLRHTKELIPHASSNSLPRKAATLTKVKPAENDTLELDLVGDDTIEIYSGEWLSDARHGFGICERTDGVAYFGQWYKNQRHGLGHTRFPDGTFEQGKYNNGRLVFLALPAGTKPHLVLYNHHVMQEVQKAVQRAMVAGEQATKKSIEAREQVSSKILDYVEKAKQAATSAREYSLEARELVREMYPDFEQPGIKYLEDIVRMMRATRRGSQTFEAALQSAKDVIAGIIRGLTRTGDEDSEEEQQPEEDLTLPPKFTAQLLELQEKKLVSRAGSVRAQRRARALKLAEELRRRERLLKGEDPKTVMASVNDARQQEQQTKEAQKQRMSSKSSTSGASSATEDERQKRGGVGGLIKPERADRWAAELAVGSKKQQNGPLGPGGKASSSAGMYLRVPGGGGKRNIGNRQQVKGPGAGTDESDGSYVDIPDMTELKHQYEIPSCPLTKLLSNPTLFSNHFDYYTTLPPPITARATASTGLYQVRATAPEVLVQPEKNFACVMETVVEEEERGLDIAGFFSKFWPWGKSTESTNKDAQATPTESNYASSSPSMNSISHLVPGHQSTTEAQQLASHLLERRGTEIVPAADSSHSIHQFAEVFDWFRANLSLFAIICLNILLLYVFFIHLSQSDEGGGRE